MGLSLRRKNPTDELRRAALVALASALENQVQERRSKPRMSGVKALAAGAVIYTAGKVAFSNRDFLRDQLSGDGRGRDDEPEDDEYEEYDEPEDEEHDESEDEEYDEPEDEEYDEPEAEEDEEPEDDEYDEPRAEEDEEDDEEPSAEEDEPEDEDYEEPSAEEDEEPEDDEPSAEEDEEEEPQSRRRPSRAKRKPGRAPSLDLPPRPSRPRTPVRT
jgi:hypothetical protein